jgi:tRNA pseudouridine38-40 synthase
MNCLSNDIQRDPDAGVRRIALGVEYDGSRFAGWQWQTGRPSVQETLEGALSRVANHPVRVICAGRTDAGVHGLAQVVHFDSASTRSEYSWQMGANSGLPPEVRVTFAKPVSSDFHARSQAIARYYRYSILSRSASSALDAGRITWTPHALDEGRMREAAEPLLGDQDFSAFRAQGCQSKSPRRIMHFIHVVRDGDRIHLDLCANAFVHHMVRNIAGALIEVGTGKRSPDWVAEILEGRDRARAGVTAPPDGLYFAGVLYPDQFDLPRHPIFDQLPAGTSRFVPPERSDAVSLAENTR